MNKIFYLSLMILFTVSTAFSQVTTSGIRGKVTDAAQSELIGATVVATHIPSGTQYGTVTDENGNFYLPGVRVGGPYSIAVYYVGFEDFIKQDVYANLGIDANVNVKMVESTALEEVLIIAEKNGIFSSSRTGAAATYNNQTINALPTIGRTINDITKYNAYSNGRSFSGQDSRLNNFTIDGSVFNNGFGLGGSAQAGGRTGTTAVSLDAIEEVQLNIAPYDVRQSGFAGAGINAVTRSGTNEIRGTIFGFQKSQDYIGKKAAGADLPPITFDEKTFGASIGGPIIKNKLFFFLNGESINRSSPALDWVANKPGATGNVSRTTLADLEDLKNFMKTNFNYDMGALENFNNEISSRKYLARFDYNISQKHKLALRYSHHDSKSDQVISNSNSSNLAGNGNRTNRAEAISAQNTGYIIQDNTRSVAAELNSIFKSMSNSFIATYNKQIEDREYRTELFPTIDILKDGTTYTSVGFDPFTPNNRLNYSTLNITNNLNIYKGRHTFTVGAAYEAFKSNNLFFFASNGVWTFNSIEDFKTAALAYKANPNLTTSPVEVARFNYRYSLLPDGSAPWQVLKVNTISGYVQDAIRVTDNFNATLGIRTDYVAVGQTANQYANPVVAGLTFKDRDGKDYKVNTGNMPKARLYWSPRLGLNYNVDGNNETQIRGGIGLFLSRIPYVLISNQLGNNGVNIAGLNITKTKDYPFTLDPSKYKPTNTDINNLSGYVVNASHENLKFPQVLKTNLAIDQQLGSGFIATAEIINNQFINSLNYFDANLKGPNGKFNGADGRDRYPALGLSGSNAVNARFINPKVSNVFILTNNNKGYAWSFTTKLEKRASKGLSGMAAYNYGVAEDLASVQSTVNAGIPTYFGVNSFNQSFSDNDLRHRFVGYINYTINYGNKIGGGTMLTLGLVSNSGGKISYTYANDFNGDGLINDLIYIPYDAKEIKFAELKTSGKTFSPADQVAAYNKFLDNNKYLNSQRGRYALRNAGYFPWLTRLDLSAQQDFTIKIAEKKNTIRLRFDIFNFGNMLNNKWGVGNVSTTFSPLRYVSTGADGIPSFTLATQTINNEVQLLRDSFLKSRTIDDVWQMQLGLRYLFNQD